MSEGSDDDRVDRIRKRRQRDVSEQSETDESSKMSEASKPSEPSETDEQSETTESSKQSVKDELVGTYMYLPESLKKDVDRYYDKISGDYAFEFDEEFEKNRHYYQLVVRHGFETVRDAEIDEVREMVQTLKK